jgi:hypothetical protein
MSQGARSHGTKAGNFPERVVEQFTSTKENPRRWVTLIFETGLSEPRGTA